MQNCDDQLVWNNQIKRMNNEKFVNEIKNTQKNG